MQHVFWVVEGRLAGRPGPSYEAWSLPELRAAGFDAVLNLSEYEPDAPEFEQAGLEVAWMPLPNTCPADEDAEMACLRGLPEAYEFVRRWSAAGRTVLVHCAWGRDRTGLLLAYHLVQAEGISPREAVARVRHVRPKALTAPGWEAMAERVIARLTSPNP